jgi:hypothetical protein
MPKRIQRKRTKGWRMPEGAVYVGRPSRYGNPWVIRHIGRFGKMLGAYWMVQDTTRNWYPSSQRVAQRFAVWMFRRFVRNQFVQRRLPLDELRGKDLVCWCRLDTPCHADILLELANK